MGLDHGLNATVIDRKTISGTYEGAVFDGVVATETPIVVETEREVEAGYWRKANAIHKWFVDNVQDGTDDCGEYRVSIGHLKELRDTAKQVLDEYREWLAIPEDERDNEEPFEFGDRLPTQAGFFFGGTDYDEWYVRDLEITIEQLDRILAEHASHGDWIDYIYQSSW
jgi:hypothetical protein